MADTEAVDESTGRWLAAFVVAVLIGHHIGVIAKPLGIIGSHVEWADVIDMTVPYVVVGSGLVCLTRAGASRTAWLVAAVGALVYVQGHGIHLAANSVGNARGNAQPVHLWDEVVGHYVWYAGTYLLVVALALTMLDRKLAHPVSWPLALLFGFTVTTNAIEGGTAIFTMLVALAMSAWAFQHREGSGAVLLAAFAPAALMLLGWGVYWQGFPQFSELGWI